jgi:cold shock protein
MVKGTVKWYNSNKGFGFIKQENGTDVFVHSSTIHGSGITTLTEGQEVTLEVIQGPKGLQASDVKTL